MSPLIEWMMMKELMGTNREGGDLLSNYDRFSKWLKEQKDAEDRKRKEDESKKRKPPTFSLLQMLIITIGTGPFLGLLAMKYQVDLLQMTLDSIRAFH